MNNLLRRASVCGLLTFMLFSSPSKDCSCDKSLIVQEVANIYRPPVSPINRLRSQFETSSVRRNQDSFSFSGTKRVGRLFTFDKAERPCVLEYPVTFDFTYIFALDLGFLDISFINPVGDTVIANETVYVYPYELDSNHRDIEFVLNDERFNASNFFAEPFLLKGEYAYEVAKLSAHSIVSQAIFTEAVTGISFSYGDGGGARDFIETTPSGYMDENTAGIVYPTIAIAQILTSYDGAVGFAEKNFPAPAFSLNPAATFGYRMKMDLIKNDYLHNSTLSIPHKSYIPDHDHISSQGLLNSEKEDFVSGTEDPNGEAWAEWHFGFSNLAEAGCPVFALYNLLLDVGFYTISLPVLISFVQLCNADLVWGLGGGCVLRQENVMQVELMIIPAATIFLTDELMKISSIPDIFFNRLALGISVGAMVWKVADYFLYNQRGIGDVLDYLELYHTEDNFFISSSSTLFSDFKTAMKPSGNGIICFWNEVDEGLNINYRSMAHFVYVMSYKSQDNKTHYVAYNVMGNSLSVNCTEPFSTRVFYFEEGDDYDDVYLTDAQAEKKVIAYYVLK